MTTGAAAGNTAGRVADKEKIEKRRALGRGLESLLPGPRVVGGAAPSGGAAGAAPGGSGVKPQVPHFVRNDKAGFADKAALAEARLNDDSPGSDGGAVGTRAGLHVPQEPASHTVEPHMPAPRTAELRSAGQPGAAVPTWGSAVPEEVSAWDLDS